MPLTEGTRLGAYEVIAAIGAGGMGEVYKALDTKLGREVAIKVLPEAFAENKERLARFEREARLLASLNHPNIATLFDLQESDGTHFLVLEFVPGETLAERIKRGSIPIEEALPLFKQIAEGLEAAHEKGVIHRDLKPANIKVTPEGKVKVLDFGLAKAYEEEAPVSDLSQSPTLTRLRESFGEEIPTAAGVIMGTVAYMSPEQARGKPVDKRSDIWAFGCCLYETSTGKKAFEGETVTDTLAAIIHKELDWEALPTATPAKIRNLLHWCLNKDPRRRLRDIGDAWTEIEAASTEPSLEPVSGAPSRRVWMILTIATALLAAILAGVVVWSLMRPAPQPVSRFALHISTNKQPALLVGVDAPPVALSPDGRLLAYISEHDGMQQLFLRPMDQLEAEPVPGTEDASQPFFSPDADWVGFHAEEKLKKVSVRGGDPLTLCKVAYLSGASWGTDDTIIFGARHAGLMQVHAGGGQPETLLVPDAKRGPEYTGHPQILPDGESVLFTIVTEDAARIEILSLETRESRVLLRGNTGLRQAYYLPTGHLVYAQSGELMAVDFDRLRIGRDDAPISVLDNLYMNRMFGVAYFTISDTGTLLYVSGRQAKSKLVWMDREGRETHLSDIEAGFLPRLSPGGDQLAINPLSSIDTDIWIFDVDRKAHRRLTFGGGYFPVWTPDGKRITYMSDGNLYWIAADGSGEAEPLLTREHNQFPFSWSPDGKLLAFFENHPTTRRDIWMLPLKEDRIPLPVLTTEFNEHSPMFSPDGRWLAYVSDESGRSEVYVQSYPGRRTKHLISREGGREPVWSADGSELFYRYGSLVFAVPIETEPELIAGTPQVLFEKPYHWGRSGAGFNTYDVAADGQRFVMSTMEQELEPARLHLVLNWFEELERLVPTN